jgi:hypothetical protein
MLRSMTSPISRVAPFDAALTAVFVVLAVVFMIAVVDDEGVSWAAVPLFTLVPVALLFRRRSPLAALAGLIVAVGVHIAAFGTVTRCGLFLPVDFLLVFAAGARLGMPLAAAGWALGVGAACLVLGWDGSAPIDEAGVFVAALVTVVWTAGVVLRAVATRTAQATLAPQLARP